ASVVPTATATPMLALMLGLAVGIDYALFIVSRYRELLGEGLAVPEAAARATGTAGSAVVFAGLTVMIALVGLSVAGIPFLTTMGVAAAVAVAIAVAISVTLTPALLGAAGERLRPRGARTTGAPSTPTRHARQVATPLAESSMAPSVSTASGEATDDGAAAASGAHEDEVRTLHPGRTSAETHVHVAGGRFFTRWVTVVTRVPALTIAIVIAGLALLTLPATGLRLALPD